MALPFELAAELGTAALVVVMPGAGVLATADGTVVDGCSVVGADSSAASSSTDGRRGAEDRLSSTDSSELDASLVASTASIVSVSLHDGRRRRRLPPSWS